MDEQPLEPAIQEIAGHTREGEKVYVHCREGNNRSMWTALSYIIRHWDEHYHPATPKTKQDRLVDWLLGAFIAYQSDRDMGKFTATIRSNYRSQALTNVEFETHLQEHMDKTWPHKS